MNFKVHSTRLFPKSGGADRYDITGIAGCCDWVILTDTKDPGICIRKAPGCKRPRHIFLSLRSPFLAISHFARHILPTLEAPFILVSGSEDVTLPNQLDQRWRRFSASEREDIRAILDHPLLRHWAAENLDERFHEKISPLPLGMVYSEPPAIREVIDVPTITPLAERPCKVLCAHRLREGPQWEARRRVSMLARSDWSDWSTLVDTEVSEPAYLDLVKDHAFVLCVEGGGIDPSPKAWQAILHGAVPIIRRTALFEAYRDLPVAWVDDWDASAITRDRLADWQAQLAPRHDEAGARAQTVSMLGLEHWWDSLLGSSPPFAGSRRPGRI